MGGFLNRAVNTAKKLISKYGSDVTIIDLSNPVYDPTTGEDVFQPVYYPMQGAISNYTIDDAQHPNVEVTDLRVLIESELPIDTNWIVQIGLIGYQIVAVTRTTTQNGIVTQALQIRE